MSYKINEKALEIRGLREQYASTVAEMEALNNRGTEEKRSLTKEELDKFDKLEARANDLNGQAERAEKIHYQHTNVNLYGSNNNTPTDPFASASGNSGEKREAKDILLRAEGAYKEWCLRGDNNAKEEYSSLANEFVQTRSVDTPTTSNTQNKTVATMGRNLLPHEVFSNELLRDIDKTNIIRQHARIINYRGANQITIPTLTDRGTGAQWLGEVDASPSSQLAFGQKNLEAFRLSNSIPVSRALIEHSAISVPSLIAQEMHADLGEKMEEAYMYGDGSGKPLGLLTTSSNGIGSDRDLSIGTASKLVTYEGFLDCLTGMKNRYKANAVLVLSSKAKVEFMKLKDDAGQYLWHNAVTQGAPNTFMGFPIIESDYINVDSDISSGDYIGFLADLHSCYWIPENRNLEMFVYQERYRPNDCIGFQVDINTGGLPVRPEAIVRLKAGATTSSAS